MKKDKTDRQNERRQTDIMSECKKTDRQNEKRQDRLAE
jgi:hypothetical protein